LYANAYLNPNHNPKPFCYQISLTYVTEFPHIKEVLKNNWA